MGVENDSLRPQVQEKKSRSGVLKKGAAILSLGAVFAGGVRAADVKTKAAETFAGKKSDVTSSEQSVETNRLEKEREFPRRKVILVAGSGGTAQNHEEVTKFATKLSQKDTTDLVLVGDGDKGVKLEDIISTLNTIPQKQKVTVIMSSHGIMKDGSFYFVLDDETRVSSKELFKAIRQALGDKPVDIFTQACHGGGMLSDKEELYQGSTLVSLTSSSEVNVGIDYDRMVAGFEGFEAEPTAYNLLEFYLTNFLKSRYKPFIATSGQEVYDLDSFLRTGKAQNIKLDDSRFQDSPQRQHYMAVSKKLANLKGEYNIFAAEYGMAMSIFLNDLKNQGLVRSDESVMPDEDELNNPQPVRK